VVVSNVTVNLRYVVPLKGLMLRRMCELQPQYLPMVSNLHLIDYLLTPISAVGRASVFGWCRDFELSQHKGQSQFAEG
jgi:hypothetical protein